jgi:hypothetical protein
MRVRWRGEFAVGGDGGRMDAMVVVVMRKEGGMVSGGKACLRRSKHDAN